MTSLKKFSSFHESCYLGVGHQMQGTSPEDVHKSSTIQQTFSLLPNIEFEPHMIPE